MKNLKLRYYLRGLGVGAVVTALVMGTTLQGEEQPLTDAQIRERAMVLGMVDGNSLVLSDLQNDSMVKNDLNDEEDKKTNEDVLSTEEVQTDSEQSSVEETDSSEVLTETEETQPAEESIETEAVETPESDSEAATTEEVQEPVEEPVMQEPAEEQTPADGTDTSQRVTGQMNAEGDTATVEIRSGAHSYAVSKVLADLGLVADASVYDRFLCDNGYSKKIHTGRYMIPVGTSEEEIAKIITGNR